MQRRCRLTNFTTFLRLARIETIPYLGTEAEVEAESPTLRPHRNSVEPSDSRIAN
jgi:hypothetical protein